MHPRTYPKVGWILLIAILLVSLTASPTQAGATAQEICEGNGGIYASGDPSNGNCYYPYDHPFSINECGGPGDMLVEIYAGDTEISDFCAGLTYVSFEFTDLLCSLWRGEFSGDATTATCTIPHDFFGDCPGTTVYFGTYSIADGTFKTTTFVCAAGGGGGSGRSGGNPGYGKFGGKIVTDEAGSSHLGGNKNGSFYYDGGTCAAGCVFTPSLPGGAANSLPDDAVATLYVRLAEGGTGSYTVCFDVSGIANPVIYRYVSGAWVAQTITFSGGQACTAASGDGAFALGG